MRYIPVRFRLPWCNFSLVRRPVLLRIICLSVVWYYGDLAIFVTIRKGVELTLGKFIIIIIRKKVIEVKCLVGAGIPNK